jgi:uncharacterized membrane protein YesL
MSTLFDPDGMLMSGLRKIADIVLCNILFCLFSLPVITAGAALTALHTAMQELAAGRDEDGQPPELVFLRVFRQDFKKSTLLWLICLVCIAFLVLYYFVTGMLTGTFGRVYRITFFVLVLVFLFGFQYIFPIEARFRLRVKDTLKNAWLLSVAAFPWTILSLAIPAGLVYILFFMNPNGFSMGVFLWTVCGFGTVTFLNSYIFLRVFRKLGVNLKPADEKSEKAEGALFTDEAHAEGDFMASVGPSYSDPNWNRKEESTEQKEAHKAWLRNTRGKGKRVK